MPSIVPAVLQETREGFDNCLYQAERIFGVERIQVDFGDGKFVPHRTLPVKELSVLNPAFHWEAHLMIDGQNLASEASFLDYQIAGFKTIIVHHEAFAREEQLGETVAAIAKLGLVPAIAINPETPVSVLRYFGDTIRHFLVMSVSPGFQGSAFQPGAADKVWELRQLMPHATIEVDGGINSSNARFLIEAGANLLAVGSALFGSAAPAVSYAEIESSLLS